MQAILRCMAIAAVAGILSQVHAAETTVALEKLPKEVKQAVQKMFPKAELLKATQEEDDGKMKYEVTVKENGKKIDIAVEADGEIEGMEKEIDVKDLPRKVTEALEKKYAKAVYQSAEAVYEIEDGKEELEYYEVQLKTAENEEIEVKIKADGTIIDEPSDAEPKK